MFFRKMQKKSNKKVLINIKPQKLNTLKIKQKKIRRNAKNMKKTIKKNKFRIIFQKKILK